MIKKPIVNILNDVFIGKEVAILSYLGDIIEEALEQKHIFDFSDLYNLIADPLNNYELCSNEQESCLLSQSVFDGLLKNQYVKNPTILRKQILKSIRIGMTVKALYWEDQQWYDAKINDIEIINNANTISVTFTGYDTTEWIDPIYIQIQPQKHNKTNKKIKIADTMNVTDDIITKFINYQIYHGDDKPQNDAVKFIEEKKKHKQIKAKINRILEEKKIENENDIVNINIDEYSDDMLRSNGHYFCYKPKCNGYLYISNDEDKVTEYICPQCGSTNCVICRSLHQTELKVSNGSSFRLLCHDYQFLFNNQFLKYWQFNTYDARKESKKNIIKYLKYCNMRTSFGVKRNSKEWNWVIECMKVSDRYKVQKIERIQNTDLWNKYYNYYQSLIINEITTKQMNVWHGTKRTEPSIIWKGLGFDVAHSKVAGCIWFAVNNVYSMDGFKYSVDQNTNKVFLAFVASGNDKDVILIRDNLILNVFKNAATYPAYVVTYGRV